MAEVIVLGSIGIDNIKTPFGERNNLLGGSAIYAAYAASFFAKVGIISVKGNDLPDSDLDFLKKRNVSLEGIKSEGMNFRWKGEYKFDMNEAKTLATELNSLAGFKPTVPESYKKAPYLFLGNTDPDVQIEVMESMNRPELILLDTMNYWIQSKKNRLIDAIKMSDMLILNDGEARLLFDTPNLIKAAKSALSWGLKGVIIKKGEHGSLLFTQDEIFNCPGYPLEQVIDPTGCGDSFGGSFIGYYAKTKDLRKSVVNASVIASFNAEGFGLEKLRKITLNDIEGRYKEMCAIREF